MALFKNMAITNQGMALYAKAQAGQEIHFTKMQVGSGQIETQNPVTLLALLDPKLDVPITSITANPEMKSATIIGNITNKDVTEATYICELGLFAKDPDEGEILYGYVSAGQYGDYYAPEAQGPYSWQYEINAAIGNAANVTAEVSRLNWDHSVINSNKTFLHLTGGNQKEINKSIDDNFESVTKQLADITTYQTAGGTANAISLNLSTLVNGYATTFIVNKNNNKNATTINGKQLYKPNTTTAPNLVTGKAVSVWYDATKDCFFIKASAEGNAVAKDVLAGKIFSNDDDTGLVGTLDLSNLTSNNIKEGITINGVKGNVKPMKYGIILNLTTKIGYETSSGYSIPGGGYVLTGRTGSSYNIECNGIRYYYDYNKSKPNYFPVPFNTGRILYYKGEHRYSTKLSSILKISTSRSNGYDYDIISSFDIAPAGYMPYQMLLVNNNWIILFTKESECIISTYDLNLSTKIKEISLNLDNPCLSYNHIFDIGNSTKIYDYTGKLIKSVEVMKPYDKLVDLNKNAAIGENEYDLGVVLHTEGSDCMCGNIVSPLL